MRETSEQLEIMAGWSFLASSLDLDDDDDDHDHYHGSAVLA